MSFAPRDRWVDVVVEQRAAMARLREQREILPPSARDVCAEVVTLLSSYSRFAAPVRIRELVDLTGYSRQAVSKALNLLTKLGVIAWQAGAACGKSYLALAHKYLPGARNAEQPAEADAPVDGNTVTGVSAAKTLGVNTVVTPVREVFDEKKTKERETAPDSSRLYETVCDPSPANEDNEPLTPDETHDVDALFAAERLAVHLFNGLPDRWTMKRMYSRFLAVPIGSTTQVLNMSLLGRPSRTVDCPHAYAVAWIATAERKVLHALAA